MTLAPPQRKLQRPCRPRIEIAPPRPLWRARQPVRAARLGVRFETALCDRQGRLLKVLQIGRNTITNFGMDALATGSVKDLVDYLVLSSTSDARKRVLSGPTLTVTYTSPTNIPVSSDAGFFVAGDVGRTLQLFGGIPELKITAFTDSQHVTCQTPSGDWLPGFTPPASDTYTVATVFFTELSTLATFFTQFNTYDTLGQTETTDSANSRFIQERIYLSAVVTGSDWTVNQLGWSDGNGSHNCFGIANLASPDTIPVGFRYRVKLDLYSVYTPIDLSGVAIDWGATIGSYTMDIRQCFIGVDAAGTLNGIVPYRSFLQPHNASSQAGTTWTAMYRTDAYSLQAIHWQNGNDTTGASANWTDTGQQVTLGSYTAGTFKRTKTVRWPDTVAITAATALGIIPPIGGGQVPILVFRPQTGTVTKPAGYFCDYTIPVYWTRDLPVS